METEYGYEIICDGCTLFASDHYNDEWYETEEEAQEEAEERISYYIQDWKDTGAWEGETEDDFEVKIYER